MSGYDKNTAARDALAFIKRQMNSADFTHRVSFARAYGAEYAGGAMWCKAEGFCAEDPREVPEFITADRFYDPDYSGEISGRWRALDDPSQYAVDIYDITDGEYLVCSCPLRPDGTWRTERLTKCIEVYTDEIVTYYSVEPLRVACGGFKDIRLVRKNWDGVPILAPPEAEHVPNLSAAAVGATTIILQPQSVSDDVIERPYAKYTGYGGKFYAYTDAEYLNAESSVFDAGEFAFFFCANAAAGRKIAKLAKKTDREEVIVGICGGMNITGGRFPASYLIPEDDPQYNRDGTSALGIYGYMLNSRCWVYDAGLALLAFTVSGDHDLCREMLERLRTEQNGDGSFNFSYDNYIGQLFEGYVRTGAIGWLVHGMCYYTLKTGDRSYLDMIGRAGEWLLTRQVTDEHDLRCGLLTGGYGGYNMDDYSYIEGEIEWCSTEHNCSALQALTGLSVVLGERKYKAAAEEVKKALFSTLYDAGSERFYQGVSRDGVDEAWALDCCTWAGKTLLSIADLQRGRKIAQTVKHVYAVRGKSITQSEEREHYNTRYSGTAVDGMRPYAQGYPDPPDIVWSEGTLGYVALLYAIGERGEAEHYLDEMIRLQYCEGSSGGVLYVTETWASLPWEFHTWESVVSSAWMYLLIKEPNALFPITSRRISPLVVSGAEGIQNYAILKKWDGIQTVHTGGYG